ncbi:MAG: glycoside hydrolase family 2 protein [Clostridia bacterium]|nr:glycoside hydrolase family 2 protein [Clostridia bacterium]
MRKIEKITKNWHFTDLDGNRYPVEIPHTWNNIDGQDGGNDYKRGRCIYDTVFDVPKVSEDQRIYLEFRGVNASAEVMLNGVNVMNHDGGYSTFRCDITDNLKSANELTVYVDNSVNDRVYPQKADFTFYGGIYRDVYLITVNKDHFHLNCYGSRGISIDSYTDGSVKVKTWHDVKNGEVKITILDAENATVAEGVGEECELKIKDVRLWQGIEDPYLYTCRAELWVDGEIKDSITEHFGVREFKVDPKKGFFLNGKSYPLRGVCRHQDRKGIGNALLPCHHEEDIELIRQVGANTLRLAHYQHDRYFYDLCDKYGLIVWAEIPYISEHMPNGRDNTISQLKELIIQNYNHPSIIFWGLSNEITISGGRHRRDMLKNHKILNEIAHRLDPNRPTALACYAVCSPFNRVAHITDLVSWNLYLGWYVPGLWLNEVWIDFFHAVFPKRPLGYSEYGCEAMPNLHSSKPKRGDHTEEYQAIYHEHMLKCFEKRPFMWATHVWNMFDFAADARDQGGEPGMNHKGLITFDRKTKKDAFYLYKAYWSKQSFVHICGKRYVNRPDKVTEVKVYSNLDSVTLYVNGKEFGTVKGDKIFRFSVPLEGEIKLEAVSGEHRDSALIRHADKPDPSYKLKKGDGKGENWTK